MVIISNAAYPTIRFVLEDTDVTTFFRQTDTYVAHLLGLVIVLVRLVLDATFELYI